MNPSLPPLFQIGSRFPELHSLAVKAVNGDANIYRNPTPRWQRLYNAALRKLFMDRWATSQTFLPPLLAKELIRASDGSNTITIQCAGVDMSIDHTLHITIDLSDFSSLRWAESHGEYDWWEKVRSDTGVETRIVPFLLKEEITGKRPYQSFNTRKPELIGSRQARTNKSPRTIAPNDWRRRSH